MYPRFTPYSIIKERQHQLVATVLVITLILSTTYYLFTSNQASATTTYTWDDIVTLDRTTQTDTTKNDFLGRYSPSNGYHSVAVTEVDDGEVTLSQNWAYNYSVSSEPALASDTVLHSFINNNLLYVSSGGGLSVINTQGTIDPGDDTLVIRYHTGSTPALASNSVNHTFLDNGLLYVSSGGGLSVINTQGTIDPGDDTLVTRYWTGSTPALAENSILHTFLDNDLLYISTADGGLSVINTQGTVDPGDDTLVIRYYTGSTPALAQNFVYHSFLNNDLLYISTNGGLFVINTQGTVDPSDDTLVTRYYIFSSLGLPSDFVFHSFIDNNLLYISTNGGLSVINTQGTIDPADDTIVNYPFTGPTRHISLKDNLLYVSTNGGFLVINTQGNNDPNDDTLVTRYNINTNQALQTGLGAFHTFLDNDTLYFSNYGGLTVISNTGEYSPSATFLSLPQPLATTPTTSLSIEREYGDGQDVSLAYRAGAPDAVWRDDFATTSSYAGDYYSWGYEFQDDSVTDGILQLSNPPSGDGGEWGAYASFNTGYVDDYFPAGSVITARVRASITDPERDFSVSMFVDEWEGADVSATTTNEWTTLTLVADTAFSTIGFETSLPDALGWESTDNFQVDWIQITDTNSAAWTGWSTACTDSVCPIDPEDLADAGNGWIQYRLDLATDNPLTTPKVLSVSYNGNYEAETTYTSTTETFDSTQTLMTFDVIDDIPDDTTITYEYSTDNATTWTPITPGTTINQSATNFTWRATLTTTNPTITPTITNVTLSTTQPKNSTATSISKRIASLEAEGKLTEAEALRKQYQDLLTIGNTREIQLEIIKKATEVVTLLERMIKLREGE